MNAVIRTAETRDQDGICALLNNELGYPNVTKDELSARMARMADDGGYETLVAELDSRVIGFISGVYKIALEKDNFLHIIGLAVAQEHQNMGIATALLRRLEECALERSVSSVMLASGIQRQSAHAFYEKRGYAKLSYCFNKKL